MSGPELSKTDAEVSSDLWRAEMSCYLATWSKQNPDNQQFQQIEIAMIFRHQQNATKHSAIIHNYFANFANIFTEIPRKKRGDSMTMSQTKSCRLCIIPHC